MKSTVVDESLSSFKPMYCSREYQASTKFQRIQNMCAWLVLRRPKGSSITQCLRDLHWLPIHQRIEFKILTLTYKCLNKQASEYLQNLLVEMPTRWIGLRSESTYKKLLIPLTKRKTLAQRSFSVATPTLWNGLPFSFKQAYTLVQFKFLLKHIYLIVFKLHLVIFYYESGILFLNYINYYIFKFI